MTSDPSPPLPVSWKRLLLAWYLDFLLFSIFATLLANLIGFVAGQTWVMQLIGFSIVRGAIGRFIASPGMMILGIERDGTKISIAFENENWLTMLLGTLFILDGAKIAVRWTEYGRMLPEFGIIPNLSGKVIFSLIWGISFIAAGGMLLQLRRIGLWIAFLTTAATIVSLGLSWPLWDQAIAHEVIARRTAQGISTRPGEIQFMQHFVPVSLVLLNSVVLALLVATRRRFQN